MMSVSTIEDSLFDEVPDEVLLQVFSHLPPWEVLYGVAGVCRRWRSLSRDRSLWQHAVLDAAACPPAALPATLLAAPALRTLAFENPYAAVRAEELLAVLALPAERRPRALRFLPLDYDADAVLAVVRGLAPHLEELSLRLHRRLPGSLTSELAAMPRLRSLRLLGAVTTAPAAPAAPAPSPCWPLLQRLDLRQAVLDRLDLLQQILASASEHLQVLLLPRYVVLPEAVLTQLCRCKRLRALGPARLEDLARVAAGEGEEEDAPPALPLLDELLVEADMFDPTRHGFLLADGLDGLRGLRGLRRVRALSLRVGDEAGAALVAAACPATERLTLRGSLSRWAADIARATPAVHSLRVVEPAVRLRLGTADPLPVRMAVLEEVCRALPCLRVLDLRDCFQRRPPPPAMLSALLRRLELACPARPALRVRIRMTAASRSSRASGRQQMDSDGEDSDGVES